MFSIQDVRNWASDYLRIWRNNKAVKAISAPTCPTIKTLLKRNECTNQPFFCKSTRWFLKFCGLSCWWNEKRKRKCKKVIPTTTKTSRKKGEEPHFLCQQNYLQLTLKLSKWKVTTTRTVTFHLHSKYPISYLSKMYGYLHSITSLTQSCKVSQTY